MERIICYGPVVIKSGKHKGKIGYYDNDVDYAYGALIYFGHPLLTTKEYILPYKCLSVPTNYDLLLRNEKICDLLLKNKYSSTISTIKKNDLLSEVYLIELELNNRMINGKFNKSRGKQIFISYASDDRVFARSLAVDLKERDLNPWLDEWEILTGDSIIQKVSSGLKKANLLVLILSKKSVQSQWVQNEWQAKYWDEITKKKVYVLPVLLEPCEIPALLKQKKYADFTKDYNEGLESLIFAINTRSFLKFV